MKSLKKSNTINQIVVLFLMVLFLSPVVYGDKSDVDQARRAIEHEDYQKAAKTLENHLNNHQNDIDAILLLVKCYYETQAQAKALALLEKASKTFENNTQLYYELGMVHFSLKSYETAIEVFENTLKMDPTFSRARFMLGVCYHDIMSISKAYEQYRLLKKENSQLADELIEIITH